MGKTSREKGKRGERELASKLSEYGWNCRRGQQYAGANGDADVVGLPGIHVECKRVEKASIYDWIDQARRDANVDEIPTVFWRKDNCDWLVFQRLEDWIEIYNESQYEESVEMAAPTFAEVLVKNGLTYEQALFAYMAEWNDGLALLNEAYGKEMGE